MAKDGAIKLTYTEEGVFLALVPPEDGGKPVDMMSAVEYIRRKDIFDADAGKIGECIAGGGGAPVKIAEEQEEKVLDEEVIVTFNDDFTEAYMQLLPADEEGKTLLADEIKDEIGRTHKVTYGIIEEALDGAIEARAYGEKTLIAQGTPPQDGVDAFLTEHFERPKSQIEKLAETGDTEKIDFRNINTYQKIEEGTVLITKTPATEAADGMNVRGGKLGAKKGRDVNIPVGKNTYLSEDKCTLFAKVGGKIEIEGVKVNVASVLRIGSDVDMSVGNVRFDGDVEIMGSVNSGFVVEAGGDLIVHGIVENATAIAGRDITIGGGARGAEKGHVKAGGDVVTKFIERVLVEAGGSVHAEYVIQSTIGCEGHVDVTAGRGAILGGTVGAGNYVVAKVIGTDSNITTEIEIGVSPSKRARMKELTEMIEQLEGNMQRMQLALAAAEKNKSEANAKARFEVGMQIKNFEVQIGELKAEYDGIGQAIQNAKDGHVHVLDKIYRGTKITIGASAYMLRADDQYVSYSRRAKDIVSEPCFYVPEGRPKKK